MRNPKGGMLPFVFVILVRLRGFVVFYFVFRSSLCSTIYPRNERLFRFGIRIAILLLTYFFYFLSFIVCWCFISVFWVEILS